MDNPNRATDWIVTRSAPTVPKTRPATIAELFAVLKNLPSQQQQIDFLRLNQSPHLLTFLRGIIDPTIPWIVDADVGYEPSTIGESVGVGWGNLRRCYLWCDLPERPSPLKPLELQKRNKKWAMFLSEHTKSEAEIWKSAAKKQLPYGLEPTIITLVFPAILQPNRDFVRQNARKLAEQAYIDALAEHKRAQKIAAEPSIADEILQAKQNIVAVAEKKVAEARARLSALVGARDDYQMQKAS